MKNNTSAQKEHLAPIRDKSKNRPELTAECVKQEIQVILSIITGEQQIVVITVIPTADNQLWAHMTKADAVSTFGIRSSMPWNTVV